MNYDCFEFENLLVGLRSISLVEIEGSPDNVKSVRVHWGQLNRLFEGARGREILRSLRAVLEIKKIPPEELPIV